MRSSSFSQTYTAGMAALLSGGGALALLLTGERTAGLEDVEPAGLVVAAVLFVVGGVGARAAASAQWPRLVGIAGVILVAVLGFLAFGEPEVSSVVFFEAAAVVCGVLFVVQAGRHPSP